MHQIIKRKTKQYHTVGTVPKTNTVEHIQSDILLHPTTNYGPKVFLLTEIKPEYSDILYNPIHFPGPLVCRIKQVPL